MIHTTKQKEKCMRGKVFYVCALMCALMLGAPLSAQAVTILQDNFDSEHGGIADSSTLNYVGFANWDVTHGSVDIIGYDNFYEFYPGNGLYVDLDGSTGTPGRIDSKITFSPGTYLLSFYLGGWSGRVGGSNNVTVMLGDYSESFDVPDSQGLTQFIRTVTTTGGALSFQNNNGDYFGAILDNVSVSTETSAVPEPGICILLGTGLLSLIGYNLRRS
jgi:hypothetical protein